MYLNQEDGVGNLAQSLTGSAVWYAPTHVLHLVAAVHAFHTSTGESCLLVYRRWSSVCHQKACDHTPVYSLVSIVSHFNGRVSKDTVDDRLRELNTLL